MKGLSLDNANRSITLEMVDKLVMGRKFLGSLGSKPAFFGSGVTHPFFMDVGKRPDWKDAFARLEMTLENSALHCLRILVGMMSKGDVFGESR
jgi:hypothetical protein